MGWRPQEGVSGWRRLGQRDPESMGEGEVQRRGDDIDAETRRGRSGDFIDLETRR